MIEPATDVTNVTSSTNVTNIASFLSEAAARRPDGVAMHAPVSVRGNRINYRQYTYRDLDEDSDRIARGLSNYTTEELRLIKGKRSNQFEKILNRPAFAEVIHRDNLVIIDAD